MDYLKQVLYIPRVDKDDTVLGPIERWEAHEQGILHRAFTVTLEFENSLVLQHRRHPVFDRVFDVTISSHPLVNGVALEETIDAVYRTLEREWSFTKEDLLGPPLFKGKLYYQAKDPLSKYQEHEICHIYTAKIKSMKLPSLECAYGFTLLKKEEIMNPQSPFYPLLAPWVKEMVTNNLL